MNRKIKNCRKEILDLARELGISMEFADTLGKILDDAYQRGYREGRKSNDYE